MSSINQKFENKLDIAQTLESIRAEMQLSKKEFADKCGVKQSFYSEIIHEKRTIKLNTLQKMCERIEIPLDIFIFKALRENSIQNPKHKRLIREISPLIDEIASELYFQKENMSYSH